ncbi:2816_t:CDS:2 [Gigaspora margarita]|uniref:2816_t:CDS:1 n=1 Tax=Gigaspora margarita TaxID=4874 RepID=A0ABM8W4Y1_GIGMA|nr:2816_t:CDS:2 [Gigaspora margarita]
MNVLENKETTEQLKKISEIEKGEKGVILPSAYSLIPGSNPEEEITDDKDQGESKEPEEKEPTSDKESKKTHSEISQPEPLPKITEKPEESQLKNTTKGEEIPLEPKTPLPSGGPKTKEYDRIIASIRAGTIRGEAINFPLKSLAERKITIWGKDFYLCRVADCSFNVIPDVCFHGFLAHCSKRDCAFSQREIIQYPNYCSQHECSSFVCSELVLAYEDGLAKYCANCLPSEVIEVKGPKEIKFEEESEEKTEIKITRPTPNYQKLTLTLVEITKGSYAFQIKFLEEIIYQEERYQALCIYFNGWEHILKEGGKYEIKAVKGEIEFFKEREYLWLKKQNLHLKKVEVETTTTASSSEYLPEVTNPVLKNFFKALQEGKGQKERVEELDKKPTSQQPEPEKIIFSFEKLLVGEDGFGETKKFLEENLKRGEKYELTPGKEAKFNFGRYGLFLEETTFEIKLLDQNQDLVKITFIPQEVGKAEDFFVLPIDSKAGPFLEGKARQKKIPWELLEQIEVEIFRSSLPENNNNGITDSEILFLRDNLFTTIILRKEIESLEELTEKASRFLTQSKERVVKLERELVNQKEVVKQLNNSQAELQKLYEKCCRDKNH